MTIFSRKGAIILAVLVLISYMLNFTMYIQIITPWGWCSRQFPFYTETLHIYGFGILGYLFGWPILILAILDEVWQLLVPGRVCDVMDMVRNFSGALIGIGIRWVVIKLRRAK